MSKVKILKVSDDITTKDIAIPVLLYLETSKNYSVTTQLHLVYNTKIVIQSASLIIVMRFFCLKISF